MENDYRQRIYAAHLTTHERFHALSPFEELIYRRPHLQNLISKYFPPDRKALILDLGCGHGSLIHFARKAGYQNIRGIDASMEQVMAAKELGIEGIDHGDVMEALAAIQPSTLDCLIAFDLIEHFNRNELISMVDGAYRALKPNGHWIIHTPNAESPLGMRMRYGDITHEIAFTSRSLRQLLGSSGFTRVNCYEDLPVPHGIKSVIRWLLWKIIRNFFRLYLAVETGDSGKTAIFSQNFLAVAKK
jgi:2-polyprenyl-3-methyl-5-hydroxy-6-metoxy-1,4-benzoquinol methylase